MSLSRGSPGSMPFSTPSRPAINIAENARYGLHEGSGERNSMRFALGLGEYIGIRLAAFPQRLVRVHARAVVPEQGLGHEGHRLAVAEGDVLDDVLEPQQLVGGPGERIEADVDLGLPRGRH